MSLLHFRSGLGHPDTHQYMVFRVKQDRPGHEPNEQAKNAGAEQDDAMILPELLPEFAVIRPPPPA